MDPDPGQIVRIPNLGSRTGNTGFRRVRKEYLVERKVLEDDDT
jgi:hypothetical protein